MNDIKVAPSILSADFSRLADEIARVDRAGADYIHIDVMDGSFVPNITIGAAVVKCLRGSTKKIFDVHLMTEHPETHIGSFAKAGADVITFHIEAAPHAHRIVQSIHAAGLRAGVSLNPATPAVMIEPLMADIDMALLMTVNPGFGGQKFIEPMIGKIRQVHEMILRSGREIELEVDGGINPETAKKVREAGADVLVAGSAVYGADDIEKAILMIRGKLPVTEI